MGFSIPTPGGDNSGETGGGGVTDELEDTIAAKVTGIGINTIQAITQADYDALDPKVATTYYIIVAD